MKGSHRIVALVLAVTTAVFAVAALAKPVHKLNASVSPAKPGTRHKPKNVELRFALTTRTDTAGEPEPTTTKAEVFLPSEFVLRTANFAGCTLATLNNQNDCPGKSHVGDGRATFVANTPFGRMAEDADITVYNGRKGKSILFHLQSSGSFNVDRGVEGTLAKAGDKPYGQKLVIRIPDELQTSGGLPVALTEFSVTIEKKLKPNDQRPRAIPYIGLGSCHDDELSFKSVAHYRNVAARETAEDKVNCAN